VWQPVVGDQQPAPGGRFPSRTDPEAWTTAPTGYARLVPRSLWNGTITFGVITVPVKLYSAVDPQTVRFREVHIPDEAKVEHRRFCSAEDREVPYDEVVKGFEVSDDEYVVLDKEEIAAAAGPAEHVIAVEAFVDAAAIDPVFYEKTYHLGPGKDGQDAYRLLHDALEKSGRTGIGRFTFHNREYVAGIRPLDRILALHTMRFADELVPGSDVEFDAPSRKPRDQEVAMAEALISSLHEKFNPGKRKDEYREAVLDMIERKAAGKKPRKPKEEPPEEAPDLMAALEASLAGKS
jgi:DNA end-binding protein Ku